MEAVQRLVRSLKSARSYELPADPSAAYYMLLSSIMQNQHREFTDLLGTSSTFDVNTVSGKSNRTLLHMAANVGAYECLCHLLRKGAMPDVSDRQGITPLQVASRNGYTRCVVKLLEANADLEIKNNEGMTAIHWLAANGRTEVFSEITKYIRNIDIEDDNHQTPLHVACMNGHIQTVRKLIDLKANLEKKSAHGCTPLFYACGHGHAEVATELVNRRAGFIKNFEGVSPLENAVKGGHGRVCFVLITSFPNLLPKLMEACLHQNAEKPMVKSVLSYIVAQDTSYRNLILNYFAHTLNTEGLKLLSPSSNYEETADFFLNAMKMFTYLMEYDPKEAEVVRPRTQSNANRAHTSNSYEEFFIPPKNIDEINFRLTSLWSTMESWLGVLLSEIRSQEEVPNKSDADLSRSSSIHSFACQLKRSSAMLQRQTSKHSASLDMLWATQPAVEINLMERLDSAESAGSSSGGYSRSDSYQNAMISLSDDLERTFSPEPEYVLQDYSSNDQGLDSHSTEINPLVESDETKGNIDHPEDPTPPSPVTPGGYVESELFEITADRLCAVIHGYFLYCKAEPLWQKRSRKKKKRQLFKTFIETNEEVLQILISRKPQLIFEHFSFVLDNPIMFQRFLPAIHTQPFEDRQKWFYDRLDADDKEISNVIFDESAVINVVRESLLQTSCKELTDKDQNILKKNVSVRFQREDGMGAGVTREWLDLLVREMLNPDFALFTLSADGTTFQPNSNSSINPDHLSYFQFAGRVMGLSLYHKHLITAYFTRSFYKHILGIPVSYKDVESIDPEYTKNLQIFQLKIVKGKKDMKLRWILDNPIDDLGLDIPFSVETDVFGQTQVIELKPNGAEILVNDENKFEYVNLAADLRMTKAIKPQILAFLKGFYEYIPHHLVSLFNEYELELLLSGVPDINLDDWLKFTTYQAGFTAEDQTIKWFWEVVFSLKREEQIQLLQFVTGTSRVPWGGFSNLRSGPTGNQLFTICRTNGKLLPTASTCFNMLKLPDYDSKEELEEKLKIAISCGSLGFEFT